MKEEFDADKPQEAQEYAGMRLSQLSNAEYTDADLEAEVNAADCSIDPISIAF